MQNLALGANPSLNNIVPLRSDSPVSVPETSAPETTEPKADTWPLEYSKGGAVVRVFKTTRKDDYTFFTVAYYQDGARKREVLADEAAARRRARKVRDDLADGEPHAAGMRLEDVRAYQSALRFLETTGVSLETACREYAEIISLLRSLPLTVSPVHAVSDYVERRADLVEGKTVEQVVDELLTAKEAGLATRIGGRATKVSTKYLTQLRLVLERFEKEVSGPITDVTAKRVNAFVASLTHQVGDRQEPVSGRTRNNYLEAIRTLFAFAKLHHYVPSDTKIFTELISWDEADFEIEIYTPAEITQLLAAADKDLKPVLAIGAFAGLRYFEITRLDWAEVNLAARHIEVKAKKAKTRARRLVPISKNLSAWLEKYKESSGPVWPHSEAYLAERLCDCARAAGMKWKHNALRHSFISYRVAQIKDVNQVALEAGNSPEIIFQHYRELVSEKEAKVWFRITH